MEAQEPAQLARLIRGQRWAALGTVTRQEPLASIVACAPVGATRRGVRPRMLVILREWKEAGKQ